MRVFMSGLFHKDGAALSFSNMLNTWKRIKLNNRFSYDGEYSFL